MNKEILYLTSLLWKVCFKNLGDAFKKAFQNQQDPWSQQEVIDAADAYMKVAYAISSLTLDDLPAFTAKVFPGTTFAEALTRQDSYQYRTFYDCTNAYHNIRGGLKWGETENFLVKTGIAKAIPENYSQPFYENGTIQHSWNVLYNEFCTRVRKYVPEEDLRIADQRHVHWTPLDTAADTFHQYRDTQPT